MSKEIEVLKEVSPVVKKVEEMVITDSHGMTEATMMLSKLNKYSDTITIEKKKITDPINEALKEIRSKYKPVELILSEAILMLKLKMSKYQSEAVAKQKEEEAKISARVKEGKGNLTAESAIKKLEALDTPEEKINTDAGAVSFRTKKCFEVMDVVLLANYQGGEFVEANETAVREAMNGGVKLPGVRYYEEQVIINHR